MFDSVGLNGGADLVQIRFRLGPGSCYRRNLLGSSGQPLHPTVLAPARSLTVLGSRPMVYLEELVKLKEWTDLLHVLSQEQRASFR